MKLHDLKPNPGAKHRKKRLGKGESSGLGKTSGKGHKGQKSRSGASIRPGFEGGQMPMMRRLPKKGFNNKRFKTNYAIVNLVDLEAKFSDGDAVNEESLRACGLVKGVCDGVKLLANGELTKKLTVTVDKISATAQAKLEKAGSKVEVIPPREPRAKKEKAAPVKAKKEAAPAAKKEKAPAEVKEEEVPAAEVKEEEVPAAEEAAETDAAEEEGEDA